LLDHHPTALFLNDYDFCDVSVEINDEKTCGTSMFFNYLEERFIGLNDVLGYTFDIESIFEYTEMVRKYDTWLWSTKYDDIIPRDLNNLFYLYGKDRFIKQTVEKLKDAKSFVFTPSDILLLDIDNEKKQNYIIKKNKEIIIKNIQGYKAGVVFAEQYTSELGNELAKMNSELDFIVIVSDKTISYRGVRDNINLGEIAKIYGGGGHPRASGSQISIKDRELYLGLLFDI